MRHTQQPKVKEHLVSLEVGKSRDAPALPGGPCSKRQVDT